jgi:hypothetical protein
MPTDELRFWSKVDKAQTCWLWMAARTEDGYGWFSADGKPQLAHRWIIGHQRGWPLSPSEWALHHCDTPPCVNPLHLYVGTVVENARDTADRGRGRNQWSQATHCIHGHEFSDANTYVTLEGHRQCRECHKMRQRVPGGYKDRTHCPQGHLYDEENTYIYRGRRNCRTCHRDRERVRRERRLASY